MGGVEIAILRRGTVRYHHNMDTTFGAGKVADLLGMPSSTVLRWCREGRVASHKDDHGHWRLPRGVVDELIQAHGSVPISLPEGWSRTEILVLTALVRAPRGLPSARAVGAVTGVSPTTASKALEQLATEGVAQLREENRIVRGRSRAMQIWYADLDAPAVQALLPDLHQIALPDPTTAAAPTFPDHLWHLFWNADPRQVDPRRDAPLIAHRAMTTSDPEAIAWAVRHLPAAAFEEALGYRGAPVVAVVWLRACRAMKTPDAAA